jgi:hypothetical protein
VGHAELPREIGHEDHARLERGDQQRLARAVVLGDLVGQLGDPVGDLLSGEITVADARVVG